MRGWSIDENSLISLRNTSFSSSVASTRSSAIIWNWLLGFFVDSTEKYTLVPSFLVRAITP